MTSQTVDSGTAVFTGHTRPPIWRNTSVLKWLVQIVVLVAVGARGDEVAGLVPAGAEVVHVADWAAGRMSELRPEHRTES